MSNLSAETLLADPILKHASGADLARLLVHVERRSIGAGDYLYKEGDPADTVFRIDKGAFALERKGFQVNTMSQGYLGEESLFGRNSHKEGAIASCDAEVLAIPVTLLTEITKSNHDVQERFFDSYTGRYEEAVEAEPPRPVAPEADDHTFKPIIGWLFAIICPLAAYQFGQTLGLDTGATYCIAIISAAVCMWLFALVSDFVPPLFAALSFILLDVAPPQQALSGFTSESFFMCLSVFGIGALMVMSGLTYRFSLWVLGHVPATSFGYNISLFGIGLMLSPIIPSVVGRMSIVAPFLIDLIKASKAGRHDQFASRLIYSATAGVALMVPLFLTAAVPNLIVFGLFDPQTQYAFHWLSWLYAASFFGLFVAVAFFLVSVLLFRGARQFSIPHETVVEQRRILGPMTSLEWAALAAVGAMACGILSKAIHRVDVPWMALAILVTMLLFGTLDRKALRANVDWPMLVYIGTIVGWTPIAQNTGLDHLIIDNLAWLGWYMKSDLPVFIGLLSVLILVVRLALPTGVTVILFATALFPVANAQGISIWVIGFIILAIADTFIFPYQSSYFVKLKNDLAAHKLVEVCDEKRIIAGNIIMIVFRVAAIYCSLLFWKSLDLI